MGKKSRSKGAEGEREVCRLLADEFGKEAKRELGQARDSGEDIKYGPFNIEVKRRKRIGGIYEWTEQAQSAGQRPVVMCRADGKDWLVVLPFAEWARLAREEI